jgi:hypothetical protein
MVCAERLRLIDKYREAASTLSAAAAGFGSKTGEELQAALAVSNAVREECATARRALQDHKAQHGC